MISSVAPPRKALLRRLCRSTGLLEHAATAPLPLLVVPDPVLALQEIARSRRKQRDVTVVGITGSIGKTSTKEVVAAVIGQTRTTYRSPGNLNSEIGLPLSLLEMRAGR